MNLVTQGQVPLFFQGTIVDIETTGLSPGSDRIITLGVVCGNQYTVVQSLDASGLDDVPKMLSAMPRPFYAFNKEFEEGFLGTRIEKELQIRRFEPKKDAIRIAGVYDPF